MVGSGSGSVPFAAQRPFSTKGRKFAGTGPVDPADERFLGGGAIPVTLWTGVPLACQRNGLVKPVGNYFTFAFSPEY